MQSRVVIFCMLLVTHTSLPVACCYNQMSSEGSEREWGGPNLGGLKCASSTTPGHTSNRPLLHPGLLQGLLGALRIRIQHCSVTQSSSCTLRRSHIAIYRRTICRSTDYWAGRLMWLLVLPLPAPLPTTSIVPRDTCLCSVCSVCIVTCCVPDILSGYRCLTIFRNACFSQTLIFFVQT